MSAPVDCRRCARCYDVVEGVSVRCAYRDSVGDAALVPWHLVTDCPCHTFEAIAQPPPAPETPARPETTAAMREAVGALESVRTCGFECFENGDVAPRAGCGCNTCLTVTEARKAETALRAALAAEEERRATEDPRDATIRDLRAALDAVLKAANGEATAPAERNWTSVARVVGMRKELDGRLALLGRCATDVGRMLALLEGHHRPQRWAEEVRLLHGLLAALRAAGKETP